MYDRGIIWIENLRERTLSIGICAPSPETYRIYIDTLSLRYPRSSKRANPVKDLSTCITVAPVELQDVLQEAVKNRGHNPIFDWPKLTRGDQEVWGSDLWSFKAKYDYDLWTDRFRYLVSAHDIQKINYDRFFEIMQIPKKEECEDRATRALRLNGWVRHLSIWWRPDVFTCKQVLEE